MRRKFWKPTSLIVLFVAAGLVLLAMRQDQTSDQVSSEYAQWDVAAVDIIQWGERPDGLAKFDTRTGEVWRFSGDPRRPTGGAEWLPVIEGVGSGPIGAYKLDTTDTPAVFLIEVATGRTWVIYQVEGRDGGLRDLDNAEWRPVTDFSSVRRASGQR